MGIVLLFCLACVPAAPALELNPLSYIFRQPSPAPVITVTEVRQAATIVPAGTAPAPGPAGSAAYVAVLPASPQAGDGVMLVGTVTEVAYAGDYDLGFAFLELSDGSGVVLLVSEEPGGDLMYTLFQTAYLRGNVVRAYTDNPVKKMAVTGFSGPGEYTAYTPDSFDLGPVHKG